jgi:hypothetical protein
VTRDLTPAFRDVHAEERAAAAAVNVGVGDGRGERAGAHGGDRRGDAGV